MPSISSSVFFIKEELVAEGTGSSKQEAEVAAAQKALAIKKW